jgi:hypothetical protein
VIDQPQTQTLFGSLPIGAKFRYQGTEYKKVAPGMAEDEKRLGSIFMGAVPGEPIEDTTKQNPS